VSAGYRASAALEAFILANAPTHHACPDAPSTFEALKAVYRPGESLPVFDGGCDHTIYSAPAVNHAFRAWHDKTHVENGYGFDDSGEASVAVVHHLQAIAAGLSREDVRALWFDTRGQSLYAAEHGGEFPTDQSAFVAACFRDGIETAIHGNY